MEKLKGVLFRVLIVGVLLTSLLLPILTTSLVFAVDVPKYWVGDGGNTSDASNHWALTSGGAPGVGNTPDSDDTVYFGAPSFTTAGQTVIVDVNFACGSMLWTGATNNPTFTVAAGKVCLIYGNLTLIAGMTVNGSGNLYFYPVGAQTVTTAGVTIAVNSGVYGSGSVTVQDSYISTKQFRLEKGTFDTNELAFSCTDIFSTYDPETSALDFTNSTINISGSVDLTPSANLTVTATGSTVNLTGAGKTYDLSNFTWNTINITGATATLVSSTTASTIALPSATTQTITFTDGTTQTASTFTLSGSAGYVHTLQGSSTAGWALSDSSGTNNYDYISVSYSTAGGGATFNANGASVNGGNNTGWNFPLTVTSQSASSVAMTKAGVTSGSFNGTLVDMGGANDTAWFEYGTSISYGTDTTHVAKTAPGTFNAALPADLTPGATYHYRAKMNNGTSDANGADVAFTLTMPTVASVASSGNTIRGNISSMGVASSTYGYFKWGYTSGSLTNNTPQQTLTTTGQFTCDMTSISDHLRRVYYKAAVLNGAVEVTGDELIFDSVRELNSYPGTEQFLLIIPLGIAFIAVIMTFYVGFRAFKEGNGSTMLLCIVVIIIILLAMAIVVGLLNDIRGAY